MAFGKTYLLTKSSKRVGLSAINSWVRKILPPSTDSLTLSIPPPSAKLTFVKLLSARGATSASKVSELKYCFGPFKEKNAVESLNSTPQESKLISPASTLPFDLKKISILRISYIISHNFYMAFYSRSVRALAEIEKFYTNKNIEILDVGCGFGETMQLFFDQGYKVSGLDPSSEAVQKSRTLLPSCEIKLVFEDIEWEYEDNSFDVVIILDVLEHVSSEQFVAEQIERVLKPGGLLIVTVPYKGLSAVLDPANISQYLLKKGSHHKHFSLPELKGLFPEHIFEFVSTEKRGIGLSQLARLLSYPFRKAFGQSFEKLLLPLISLDYKIQSGPFAYHIFLSMKKHESK